jgi:hypothetical protein
MHTLYGSNLHDARLHHMVVETTRIPPEFRVDALPAPRWPHSRFASSDAR